MSTIDPAKLNKRIVAIVEKYGLLIRYMLLGPTALTKTQLKVLVTSGLLRPKHIMFNLADMYTKTHMNFLSPGVKPATSVRDYALKHLKSSAAQFVDTFVERQKSKIGSAVSEVLMRHTQQLKDASKEELVEGLIHNKSIKQIASAIRDRTGNMEKDMERLVIGEIARAQALGSVDAIIENNKDKNQSEIYVFKTGPHQDGKVCKFCQKFWFLSDGITPRVYKLSELLANGDNIGKKQADWLPTATPTHPHERHYLLDIPKGYGFKAGQLVYISKDHNEYEAQKGK